MNKMEEQKEKKKLLNRQTSRVRDDLSRKSEVLRMQRLLKEKQDEQGRLLKEQRAEALKKKQMEIRRTDELKRHKNARNIIEENRVRVALQSELVGNQEFLDPEYRDQINCILGDQFGSIEEKMRVMNAQQSVIENNEEMYIKQMDIDTQKEITALNMERERQTRRDEKKLVDGIYNKFLV